MKILITGATGLVGHALIDSLSQQHSLTIAGRSIKKLNTTFKNKYISVSNQSLMRNAANILKEVDCVINLAGENIGAKRWSAQQLKKINDSRVELTTCLATAAASLGAEHAPRLINASAIGIYGLQPTIEQQVNTTYDETSPLPQNPTDELSKIGLAWEGALAPAINASISVAKLRFGVILAKEGGALAKLLPSFKLGGGAILGSGKQPFTWVALPDVIRAIEFMIQHPNLSGAYNVVAPELVDQATFAKTLAKVLNKPCFMPMPEIAVKMLFGKMGEELLLNGQRVAPTGLLNTGFEFEYPRLESALQFILK